MNVTHENGSLNLNWLREQRETMTEEKQRAILLRNEVLSQIPSNERKQWIEEHPLELFIR